MALRLDVCVASFRLPVTLAYAAAALILLPATNALAGITISVGPNYPTSVRVGQNGVPVSLTISNNSSDDPRNAGGDSLRSVTVDQIFHTPACGVSGLSCPTDSRDAGVFQVTGKGTGSGGESGCAGTWTLSSPDGSGEVELVPPGGPGTLVLGPSGGPAANARCTIVFSVNVVSLPSKDADPATDGVQTDQLARGTCHFSNGTAVAGGGSGSDKVTVAPAQ